MHFKQFLAQAAQIIKIYFFGVQFKQPKGPMGPQSTFAPIKANWPEVSPN
jgi:hypothetical protein